MCITKCRGAGVPDGACRLFCCAPCTRRDQQRRQDSQNCRFSRAICAQPCDCFAFLHLERNTLQRRPRRALTWLDLRAYSGARWRIIFLQILQDNSGERRGILHRIFIAFPALQYKPYPGVRIWRRAVVNQGWERYNYVVGLAESQTPSDASRRFPYSPERY